MSRALSIAALLLGGVFMLLRGLKDEWVGFLGGCVLAGSAIIAIAIREAALWKGGGTKPPTQERGTTNL